MAISVFDPLNPAMERTKVMLFRPFDFEKWIKLGFCAFLMALGDSSGGNGGNFTTGSRGSGEDGGADFDDAMQWLQEYAAVIAVVVIVIVLLAIAVGLVFAWLSSRGRFMFLDGVVQNRGAVVEPWREYRSEANSLFLFRVCFMLIAWFVFLMIAGLAALIALPDIQQREFGGASIAAIAVGVMSLIVAAVTMSVIRALVMDFVVVVMYLRRTTIRPAWREFRESMLRGNGWSFVKYFLFKILMGMVIGFFALAVTCLMCCIPAIPFVGTVILLPLAVFVQSYELYFIEQFGPKFQVFAPRKEPPPVVTPV